LEQERVNVMASAMPAASVILVSCVLIVDSPILGEMKLFKPVSTVFWQVLIVD
jgi:hypothetical protein